MATLNSQLLNILDGASYLPENGLKTYWSAQYVKRALRRKDPNDRLSGVREALNRYRVTAWLTEDNRIELRKESKPVLTL